MKGERVPMDQLLMESDIVVVCCPLTPETQEMFDYAAFRKMKKNAVSGGKRREIMDWLFNLFTQTPGVRQYLSWRHSQPGRLGEGFERKGDRRCWFGCDDSS